MKEFFLGNLVASKLHQFNVYNKEYALYYDSNKKGRVDFILHKEFTRAITYRSKSWKKDKKQIQEAINNYKSEYGIIIISNNLQQIEKKEDIIYIPSKTFAVL